MVDFESYHSVPKWGQKNATYMVRRREATNGKSRQENFFHKKTRNIPQP